MSVARRQKAIGVGKTGLSSMAIRGGGTASSKCRLMQAKEQGDTDQERAAAH